MTTEEIVKFLDDYGSFSFRIPWKKEYPSSIQLRTMIRDESLARRFVAATGARLDVKKHDSGDVNYWISCQGKKAYELIDIIRGKTKKLQDQVRIIDEFIKTKAEKPKFLSKINQGDNGKRRLELLSEMRAANKRLWHQRNIDNGTAST